MSYTFYLLFGIIQFVRKNLNKFWENHIWLYFPYISFSEKQKEKKIFTFSGEYPS